MSSTLELLLAIALIVAVTLALVLQRRLNAHRKGGGGGGGPRPPHPREQVSVHVERHEGALRIRVDPWDVDVTNGKPLRWVFHADAGATMRIAPKTPGDWPFPDLPPQVPVQAGGSVNAGVVKGTVGSRHAYSVLVDIDGQKLDIDPDIWICF